MKRLAIAFALLAFLSAGHPARALEPITIELLTLPFGTASYAFDMAMESMFKEVNGPVTMLLKQTPGAMFISRYNFENLQKMRAGKVPFTMSVSTSAITMYMAEGLPPYEKYPAPDSRILCSTGAILMPFVAFDPAIKTPADFKGKKVGVAERSRPNQSTLPNQPVFDYAYGGYDKVAWQYLGFANSKDAMLNGSIDVYMGNISSTIKQAEDGTLYADSGTMDPSMMEVVSSGNKFHIVAEDPAVLKAAYDPAKHLVQYPVLMKAGTVPGQTEDVWVKGGFTIYGVDKDMPEDVVEEIVYQMFTHKERLADYYEGFAYMGDSPYPAGLDPKWVHPGTFRAMKRLGLPLPAGVSLP